MQRYSSIKIISALSLVNKNYEEFRSLILNVYNTIEHLYRDYPNFRFWYWFKTVPAIRKGTREMIVCMIDDRISGVSILKNEDSEKKICTLLVLEQFRNKNVATALLEESFIFLETSIPLITIPEYKLDMFENIIKKYNWQITDILDEEYYSRISTSREFVLNGNLSKK